MTTGSSKWGAAGWRERWRQVRFGLATVLGLKRLGFFIPCRFAGALPVGDAVPPYPAIGAAFTAAAATFGSVLADIERWGDDLLRIGEAPPPAPRWHQDWFPPLDAAAAYVIIRRTAPARIIEVGSGHSTRFFARAIADGGFPCRLTAIDPAPRASLAGLDLTLIRSTVQAAGLGPFADLRPGDVLAVDSSHILMPGTDVDFILNRVLPSLPLGIIFHIHDVFLPDGYPVGWSWRGYNEQQAVAVLVAAGGWLPLWSSRFMATRHSDRIAANPVLARVDALPGLSSSLWLQKH